MDNRLPTGARCIRQLGGEVGCTWEGRPLLLLVGPIPFPTGLPLVIFMPFGGLEAIGFLPTSCSGITRTLPFLFLVLDLIGPGLC